MKLSNGLEVDEDTPCPRCEENKAVIDNMYGVMPCQECKERVDKEVEELGISHGKMPEFVPDRIKEDRKKYFNSLVQPWRQGEASKEFIEAHPDKADRYFSKKEQANAKYVWRDLPNWKNRHKTQ